MGCGVDHDFLLPRAAFGPALRALATRWPDGLAELAGGALVPFSSLADRAVEALGDGFVAYRDAAARARFHRDGSFVDDDGESPLNAFVVSRDAARVHLDLVFELGPSPAFLVAVHEAVGGAVADLEAARGSLPVNAAWLARNLPAVLRVVAPSANWVSLPVVRGAGFSSPQGAVLFEDDGLGGTFLRAPLPSAEATRALRIACALWFRMRFDAAGAGTWSMPPGELAPDGPALAIAPEGGRPSSEA